MKQFTAIFNIFLTTAALYFSVNAFYKLVTSRLDHGPLTRIISMQVLSIEDINQHSLSYYKTISERNLFNIKKKPEQKSNEVNIEALKQTELKLKLWGTVTGNKDEIYAVIEDPKGRKQNLYRIGDTVQNAIVKMILREKVILNVDGKDEFLEMEEMYSSGKPIKRYESPGTKISQKKVIKRSQIENAVKNISQLMKQVKIRPHFENGISDGLSLSGIRPNSIFRKMGLKNGDILVGVEGNTIESVDDALKLYESLKTSSSVTLEIKRRGQPQTINFNIE